MSSDVTTTESPPKIGRKLSLLKSKDERTLGDTVRNLALEILALFAWSYTICAVFITDVDRLATTFLPGNVHWLVEFKLLVFLSLACAFWLWLGTRDAVVWFLYITFYPLVLLLIRLPIFIYKRRSWLLAFFALNTLVSFFKSLKYKLFFATTFLSAAVIGLFSTNKYFVLSAAVVLSLQVVLSFVRSFWMALQPSVIFQLYSKFFHGVRRLGKVSFELDKDLKNLPVSSLQGQQLEKWNSNLQSSVLFNRFCLFVATRLRDYQKSEWRVVPAIFGLLGLVLFSVISFAMVYHAIYKLDPSQFTFSEPPSFFTFLFYSFNVQIINSISQLDVSQPYAQSAFMLQSFLSLIVGLILATVLIASRTQRTSAELDRTISDLKEEAAGMELFIREEFKVSGIGAAMEHLKEAKFGFISFIFWLTQSIEPEVKSTEEN